MSPFKSSTFQNTTTAVTTPVAFAQTISDLRGNVNGGHNLNFITNQNAPRSGTGFPTDDVDWQLTNIWSTSTNQNDGFDYLVSNPSVYTVLEHGFKINKAGFHRVTCELGMYMKLGTSRPPDRLNVAIQFAIKESSSATWTRIGAPVATGYLNVHSSSETNAFATVYMSSIISFNVGDEIAIFSSALGADTFDSARNKAVATSQKSTLRIESLN